MKSSTLSDDDFSSILEQERKKRARVGPLPGVTQDIAGFKVNISAKSEKEETTVSVDILICLYN